MGIYKDRICEKCGRKQERSANAIFCCNQRFHGRLLDTSERREALINFEITRECMKAGLHNEQINGENDVIDNLAAKMRKHKDIRLILQAVERGDAVLEIKVTRKTIP